MEIIFILQWHVCHMQYKALYFTAHSTLPKFINCGNFLTFTSTEQQWQKGILRSLKCSRILENAFSTVHSSQESYGEVKTI